VELRTWFRLVAVPEGPQLEALLDFAVARRAHYPTFLLVERSGQPGAGQQADAPASAPARELFAALAPHLITTAQTDRWPGTRLSGGTAAVHFFRLERHSAQVLGRCGSLAAFVPPLPEDLCLLASDKTPWLVSKTREGRFLLQLTAEEQRAIAKALPWLGMVAAPGAPD
jgi:hypothetical protein